MLVIFAHAGYPDVVLYLLIAFAVVGYLAYLVTHSMLVAFVGRLVNREMKGWLLLKSAAFGTLYGNLLGFPFLYAGIEIGIFVLLVGG